MFETLGPNRAINKTPTQSAHTVGAESSIADAICITSVTL